MSSKPRVLIDGRMVEPVKHGFGRYVSQLAEGLHQLAARGELPYDPVFLVGRKTAREAFGGFQVCEVGAGFLSPVEWLELPRVLKGAGAALYHSPTFSSLPSCPVPWVVTVHDLNHLQFGGLKERLYYEKILKPFVLKASAVATVSEFSRGEIAAWSGLKPEQIEVAYNAIDLKYQEKVPETQIEEVLARHGLKRGKYFFCLSNPKPHKNTEMLASAFEAYRAVAGESAWDLALSTRMGPVKDDDARALVAGAGAVVFPSLYEGFGLPPVEAACQGVPLVVSRIPPHREGLADLEQGEVLWVDPKDEAAWAKALARAAQGQVLGVSIESRSRLMRRFSALNLGSHMDRIYRRVLGMNS